MAKKSAKTTPAKIDENGFYFTVVRHMPGDDDQKPTGLLFASRKAIGEEMTKKLMTNAIVRDLMPGKPLMAIMKPKPEFNEYRVLVSWLSYDTLSMQDKSCPCVAFYEETVGGAIKKIDYTETLNSCAELFRAVGCNDCPKKGKECLQGLLGAKTLPWIYTLPFNRKDEFCKGLNDGETDILKKDAYVKTFELVGKGLKEICDRLVASGIEGATFVHPNDTKTKEVQNGRPLRLQRDHVFFDRPAKE